MVPPWVFFPTETGAPGDQTRWPGLATHHQLKFPVQWILPVTQTNGDLYGDEWRLKAILW